MLGSRLASLRNLRNRAQVRVVSYLKFANAFNSFSAIAPFANQKVGLVFRFALVQ